MLKLVPTNNQVQLVAQTIASEFLVERYQAVRARSVELTRTLSAEDQCIQAMPQASPTKWHLAHTTWFFETLVLSKFFEGYRPFNERYSYLFNSYYESIGDRIAQHKRGLLSRPSLQEVLDYRSHVDEAMSELYRQSDGASFARMCEVAEVGLQHEQQHQELILTDILNALWHSPLLPSAGIDLDEDGTTPAPGWVRMDGCDAYVGHAGAGFAFDNEGPAHLVRLHPYAINNRLVTNAEFEEFIADDGYDTPSLWLSEGWSMVRAGVLKAPLYWLPEGREFSLQGVRKRQPFKPVKHLSFYEAAAYATWAEARLPTEFEWEVAVDGSDAPLQAFGAAWQWTRSAYEPYPRYRPAQGPLGEYNGKFMVGQQVLRGSSAATPRDHERPTYRNFFSPSARWQFTGIRLAKDL